MSAVDTNQLNPEVWKLFDKYVHGLIDRRGFLDGTAKYAVGGLTAVGILEALSPKYAEAQTQIGGDDGRIQGEYVEYPSPDGYGTARAYLVRPANATGRLPGVLVVHENRGLNPHIEDVARRAAVAGFVALAPDALFSLGGYPGIDAEGVQMQRKLEQPRMLADFVAGARYLASHSTSTGRIGATGFCFGGSIVNQLAVQLSEDLAASAPFYGGQPRAEDVPRISAELAIHYASDDDRINMGWPAYEAALKANGVTHQAFFYPDTMHGFHNDTTPRFRPEAAKLAWQRTVDLFNRTLQG